MTNILKSHSILYAEDDIALQKNTAEYLNRYFGTVYVASDGKQALQLYTNNKPDVLMLDIDMPYLDGLEVAKTVRQNDSTTPILMFTAHTDTNKLLTAAELNLCKYLVKPVTPKVFKEVMQRLSEVLSATPSHSIDLSEGYVWQTSSQKLYENTTLIPLSQKEQALLSLLLAHRGTCVSFEDIMAHVWEDDFDVEVSIDSVKYQVSMLRKKLPKGSLQNVYAKGYVLN